MISRDEARIARDLIRVDLQRIKAEDAALLQRIYDGGDYRDDLPLAERDELLKQWSIGRREIVRLARYVDAYNAIISYRPDAKLDPADRDHETRWEAWDKQDTKQELAERAQAWLAEVL